jgi:hypothetical protein
MQYVRECPFPDMLRVESPHGIDLCTARHGGSRDVFRTVSENERRARPGRRVRAGVGLLRGNDVATALCRQPTPPLAKEQARVLRCHGARWGRGAGVCQRAIGAGVAPASAARQQRSRRDRVPCDAAAACPWPPSAASSGQLAPTPLKAQRRSAPTPPVEPIPAPTTARRVRTAHLAPPEYVAPSQDAVRGHGVGPAVATRRRSRYPVSSI